MEYLRRMETPVSETDSTTEILAKNRAKTPMKTQNSDNWAFCTFSEPPCCSRRGPGLLPSQGLLCTMASKLIC